MRITLALVGLVTLGACSQIERDNFGANIENLDLLAETRRAFSASYQDQPFEDGMIYVVAEEHGDLHTYSLRPCHGETRICGGSGGVGHLRKTPDYTIVTGAYHGRTFFLSPGGDGVLRWRGVDRTLAWE